MAIILPVKGITPKFGKSVFIAENATVVGDVVIGDHCSIWFSAVVRGDVNYIRVGNFTNIQDGAVIHCTYLKNGTDIGNNVSIGHKAIIHGCVINDYVLVGMGAIIMDKAIVESNVIVAAGAIVLENSILESGFLYAGIPAKKIKALSENQLDMLQKLPQNYLLYSSWFE
ncbi:gamma carbonic anhydrase family protein [Sphingobacterium sp. LRF_L2]|uniref:gamma carbonic anhydrase family protein n=1 Tax=Sphingobacterium sp. LRF_L2 TaxID=3369421 RepID=UPI003F626F47